MKNTVMKSNLTLFVTVGSTRFDALIAHILKNLKEIEKLGFKTVILQIGQSDYDNKLLQVGNINVCVDLYKYKNSILEDIKRANVVIGHAGAGTCLEVLRLNKKLLVVVNETLMDNHQNELADKLASENYLSKTNVHQSIKELENILNHDFETFPPPENSNFEGIFKNLLQKSLNL